MRERIAAIVLALSLGTAGAIVAVIPAHAAPLDHARIKNASNSTENMRVCRDWSGSKSDPGCKNGTAYRTLKPGQSTPKGEDWDAFFIPNGCYSPGPGDGPYWFKVTGFFGATKTYALLGC